MLIRIYLHPRTGLPAIKYLEHVTKISETQDRIYFEEGDDPETYRYYHKNDLIGGPEIVRWSEDE